MASVHGWINIVLVFCVVSQYQVECASNAMHLKLIKDLFKDQAENAYLRPVNDTNEAVFVGFRFTPTISVLDETSQELQVRGMLVLTWEDYRLVWKPAEYDGIGEINVPLFKGGEQNIWKPELVLNESLVTDFQSFQPETTSVTLSYTGTIYWYTLATMTSFCRIAVLYYPFDKQTCHLTFTTWLYQKNEQTFYTIDDIIKNETYKRYEVKHGLWDINILEVKVGNASYDCSTCDGQEQSYVHYALELTRGQPWLYFLNLLLPCIVMSVMTLLAVCLPPKDDADAATFALTCILALFVFMTFLFTLLPSTGQPLIGYYIVWLIVEGVVVTLCAVKIAHVTDSVGAGRRASQHENETRAFVNQGESSPDEIQSVSYKVLHGVVNEGSSTDDVDREDEHTFSSGDMAPLEMQINDTVTDGTETRTARPKGTDKVTNKERMEYWNKGLRYFMIVVKFVSSLVFLILFSFLFSL